MCLPDIRTELFKAVTVILRKLYVRVWLAVVLAVTLLTFLAGWAWRATVEPPLREVVVRNETGQIIGYGHSRMRHAPGLGLDPQQSMAPEGEPRGPRAGRGIGPEYLILMNDGHVVSMNLPRNAPAPWIRPPFGFLWTLGLVAVAVALATYPIVRTLTRRLERLQEGVQRWGAVDLSVRLPEHGKDEVAFLAQRFNLAAQRIETLVHSREALLASQKSLLANASHELRSPLARIRMGLELMGAPSSPAARAEIERNIAELDTLVEEILLASRLDAQEVDLGTVEAVDLVGLLAEECARVGADLSVEVQDVHSGAGASGLTVHGINKLLRRLVRNLLENARRYAPGSITVTLALVESCAELRVADNGPGVPEALRERIFEPFYRLPGATERDGGVGLGLALVRSIAERHGGSVRCESGSNGGACFVVRLPV